MTFNQNPEKRKTESISTILFSFNILVAFLLLLLKSDELCVPSCELLHSSDILLLLLFFYFVLLGLVHIILFI